VPWAQWPPPEGPLTGALQLISSKQGKKLAAQQNKLDAINFEELAEVFASFDLDPCISAIRSEPDPLIRDRKLAYIIGRGKRRAILLVSPEEFPDVASNERARTDLMRRHLGDDLGSVIPEYFATGYLRSQSYSLSPLLPTISADRFLGRFQVFQIRKSLFEWIQNINSRCNVVSDSVETEFIRPLEYLSRFDDPVIQQAASAALGRLYSSGMRPRRTPMHNDLWRGNILRSRQARYPFAVVDWGGSRIDGFPIFDLLRASMSFRLPSTELRKQIALATKALDCEPIDSFIYVMAALGEIAMRSDQFPLAAFSKMAHDCLFELRSVFPEAHEDRILRGIPRGSMGARGVAVEMPKKLLLVLPINAHRFEGQVFVDEQARNGLRLWLENLHTLALACPTKTETPPSNYLPIDDDRISFTPLPVAYEPQTFIAALPRTISVLRELISSSDHLHFAIGGLFGDWASVSAILAHRKARKFTVWTDRVESSVLAFQAQSKTGLKKYYSLLMANLVGLYERRIIELSDLGLFHGMDCYKTYSQYCKNPQLVHDIHLDRESQISDDAIADRLTYDGPIRIAYAGRGHRDKGIYDWIDTLSLLAPRMNFRAVWFGAGPELALSRQIVTDRGLADRILFPGPTKTHRELIENLRSFDLFMFCHKTPESPRCLVEALICGLPLIGYATPYSCDLIKHHGGGILTPPQPSDLADAVSKFSEQRAALTRKAKLDGTGFDSDGVFRHRSEMMKALFKN
jgi:colanic acid/amylovoran biosynthesis glycosyltransferase